MKKTTIGGSALIEGLMMIGPDNAAIAVRKPDGEIIVEKRELPVKSRLTKIPVIRGVVSFYRQMLLSTKAMMFSASFVEMEDEESHSFIDKLLEKIFGNRLKDAVVYFSLMVSFAFSIGLFILLPNILASFLHFDKSTYLGVMYYNFFEGAIRISMFLGYLALASRMKDIKRVWEYHGAEHKTINCYENGEDLTVGNVMRYSTKNPRCGTSYIFLVLVVSILVFSFLGWYSTWLNVLIRFLLMPLVAGLSFELFKLAGASNSMLADIVRAPGMLFQYFTTKEPDEQQVEVAISAFNNVVPDVKGSDNW